MDSLVRAVHVCAFSVATVFHSVSDFMYLLLVIAPGGRGTSRGGASLGWNLGHELSSGPGLYDLGQSASLDLSFLVSGTDHFCDVQLGGVFLKLLVYLNQIASYLRSRRAESGRPSLVLCIVVFDRLDKRCI